MPPPPSSEPKWRRRKTARPAEIVAAAQAEFADKGFAAARLEDIARRAGVSKGALYLYFDTKTDLFRAVVQEAVAPDIAALAAGFEAFPGPIWRLLQGLFERLPQVVHGAGVAPVAKMVIGESRNFPDLARVWHDSVASVALGALTGAVAKAQARGEVRPGEPRLYAVQLIAPMLIAVLWAEVFVPAGGDPIPVQPLARQHLETALRGMLTDAGLAAWNRDTAMGETKA